MLYGRVTGIIQTRFLQVDFRQSFVKILANPSRICCVLCLGSPKISSVKNLRPESANFCMIFGWWGRRKADAFQNRSAEKRVKIHAFGRVRVILVTLPFECSILRHLIQQISLKYAFSYMKNKIIREILQRMSLSTEFFSVTNLANRCILLIKLFDNSND